MFFFSGRRRHTRWPRDWSSDVCSSDLAAPIGLHGEGVVPGQRGGTAGTRVARVVGTLGDREVGDVVAGPSAGFLVPPHQLLALAPRSALRVRRGAVVQDAPIGGPCPSPFGGDLVLLGTGRAPAGLVDAVRV